MKLVIQIPAFNEEATIERALAALPRRVPGFTETERLVIDDGSTDATSEKARAAGADRIVRLTTNRGPRRSVFRGTHGVARDGRRRHRQLRRRHAVRPRGHSGSGPADPRRARRLRRRRSGARRARALFARQASAPAHRELGGASGRRHRDRRRRLGFPGALSRRRAADQRLLEAHLHARDAHPGRLQGAAGGLGAGEGASSRSGPLASSRRPRSTSSCRAPTFCGSRRSTSR